jgi:isochorismate hydrolase
MELDVDRILKELKPYRERKARIEPSRAALLVIDMQNYFHRIVGPILKNTLRVIRACRERGVPIIFTQHGHRDPASDGGILGTWWGEMILEGTEDWKLLKEMEVEATDLLLPKKRYSAFYGTDLDETLRDRGIKDLIISGVMTNLCCETTARDAFMRDYQIFFLIDGTAAGKSDLHVAALKNLGYGFAYLLTCEELIKTLTGC